jgi:short-subunit dehydrogenase
MLGAGESLANQVRKLNKSPEYMINNVGHGGLGQFNDQNLTQINQQTIVNVFSLTEISRIWLRPIIKAKRGAILPGPLQAVYFTSIAYVLRFSEALSLN